MPTVIRHVWTLIAKGIADELMAARVAAAESGALPPMGEDAGVGGLIARSIEDGRQGAGPANAAASGMPQPMQMETGIGRLIGVVLIIAMVTAGFWMFA